MSGFLPGNASITTSLRMPCGNAAGKFGTAGWALSKPGKAALPPASATVAPAVPRRERREIMPTPWVGYSILADHRSMIVFSTVWACDKNAPGGVLSPAHVVRSERARLGQASDSNVVAALRE